MGYRGGGGGGFGGLQGSHNEHHGYADLLLPVQLQVDELGYGEPQHPEIQQDADCGVCPAQSIDVQTLAFMFSVPSRPVEVNRFALEDREENEQYPEATVEDNSAPDDTFDSRPRKDPKVKEQEREFQQRNLEEVQDLHAVECVDETSNLIGRESPYISAQTVGKYAVGSQDHARDTE